MIQEWERCKAFLLEYLYRTSVSECGNQRHSASLDGKNDAFEFNSWLQISMLALLNIYIKCGSLPCSHRNFMKEWAKKVSRSQSKFNFCFSWGIGNGDNLA